MTQFRYEAARTDGKTVRGLVEATSGPDAAAVLSARGLFPVALRETRVAVQPFWRRPPPRALATTFQGLAALTEAGVPLEPALQATERVASGTLRDALGRVRARVREGTSLGAALAAEDGLFPGVAVGLVRAGERGAGLSQALDQAAAQLERDAETRARVRSALAYPLVVALVGTASVAFIVGFVVPRFAAVLGDLGRDLPAATRVLVALSEVVRAYGVVLAAGAIALVAGGAKLAAERREAWHAWLLDVPLVGAIRHALASARAGRTLAALLAGGAPALAALAAAREAAGDAAVAHRLTRARERVREGAALSDALGATRALTPAALELAALGERSGRLAPLLERAADLDERTAERRLGVLVTLLEPALIVAFAGVVAFVAAALLQAVYAVRPG